VVYFIAQQSRNQKTPLFPPFARGDTGGCKKTFPKKKFLQGNTIKFRKVFYEIYWVVSRCGSGGLGVYGCKKKGIQDPCCRRMDARCVFADDCFLAALFVYKGKEG